MGKQTAHAARALTRVRAQIDWDAADDRALVRGMLGRNDGAWLAFLGRFDVLLTKRIEATIGHWSRMLQTPEMIERIKGDVQSFLVENSMEALRAFHPRHGTLANWLSRIAHASAVRRLQTLTRIPDEDESLAGDR
jgi:hypothetical protein